MPHGAIAEVYWSPCSYCGHMLEFDGVDEETQEKIMHCPHCTWTGWRPHRLLKEQRDWATRPRSLDDGRRGNLLPVATDTEEEPG